MRQFNHSFGEVQNLQKSKSTTILKESKVRKIVEFFEPINLTRSDVVKDVKSTNAKEEMKSEKNAFSLLMRGARSTTPRKGKLKRLDSASTKKR